MHASMMAMLTASRNGIESMTHVFDLLVIVFAMFSTTFSIDLLLRQFYSFIFQWEIIEVFDFIYLLQRLTLMLQRYSLC